ncbi:MAG: YdcH family protein [bacterium]
MPIEKHELYDEFPEHKERIHTLKLQDRHFLNLYQKYDDITHEVYKYEMGSEATSDDHLEALKKERLHLKDNLYSMITAA